MPALSKSARGARDDLSVLISWEVADNNSISPFKGSSSPERTINFPNPKAWANKGINRNTAAINQCTVRTFTELFSCIVLVPPNIPATTRQGLILLGLM